MDHETIQKGSLYKTPKQNPLAEHFYFLVDHKIFFGETDRPTDLTDPPKPRTRPKLETFRKTTLDIFYFLTRRD